MFPTLLSYLEYRGWKSLVVCNDASVVKLKAIQEKLRAEKLYPLADEIRSIIKEIEQSTNYVRGDLMHPQPKKKSS